MTGVSAVTQNISRILVHSRTLEQGIVAGEVGRVNRKQSHECEPEGAKLQTTGLVTTKQVASFRAVRLTTRVVWNRNSAGYAWGSEAITTNAEE
jgi:hypothetical protein